jgi:hypothetical protein
MLQAIRYVFFANEISADLAADINSVSEVSTG